MRKLRKFIFKSIILLAGTVCITNSAFANMADTLSPSTLDQYSINRAIKINNPQQNNQQLTNSQQNNSQLATTKSACILSKQNKKGVPTGYASDLYTIENVSVDPETVTYDITISDTTSRILGAGISATYYFTDNAWATVPTSSYTYNVVFTDERNSYDISTSTELVTRGSLSESDISGRVKSDGN